MEQIQYDALASLSVLTREDLQRVAARFLPEFASADKPTLRTKLADLTDLLYTQKSANLPLLDAYVEHLVNQRLAR
jgi:hypothetical protein